MVGRKVTLAFPMACDRCGRTMRQGEVVAQRTYPTRTYVTHIVCPGRKFQRGGFPRGVNKVHENTNDNMIKE